MGTAPRGNGQVVVQKYGGSSVSGAARIRRIAAKICERSAEGAQLVVVVSAMGRSTDELIALAGEVTGPDRSPSPREMDTLLSTGELVSSTLMAMAIQSFGQEVVSLSGQQAGIRTDAIHGSARISSINTDRLRRELDAMKDEAGNPTVIQNAMLFQHLQFGDPQIAPSGFRWTDPDLPRAFDTVSGSRTTFAWSGS